MLLKNCSNKIPGNKQFHQNYGMELKITLALLMVFKQNTYRKKKHKYFIVEKITINIILI